MHRSLAATTLLKSMLPTSAQIEFAVKVQFKERLMLCVETLLEEGRKTNPDLTREHVQLSTQRKLLDRGLKTDR